MVTATEIRRRHPPDGDIQWLRVKPWMCSIGKCAPCHTAASAIHMAIEIANNLQAFFVVTDLLLPTNIAK